MKKLDLTLMRTGNTLLMRVNHIDEELRGKGMIFKKGSRRMYSIRYPELRIDSVCIAGTLRLNETNFVCLDYKTSRSCYEMIRFIKSALKHINGSLKSKHKKLEQVI